MNNTTVQIIIFFLCVFSKIQAQQTVDASGGEAIGSGGNVSYSIGQTVFTTHTGSNGSVAQGVQQPYEITTVLAIDSAEGINLQLSVFPNPSSDFINLKIENYEFQIISYQLYDANGKLYRDSNTTELETKIEIGNLPTGLYFLDISDENRKVKTFKIIKNN